MIFQISRIAEAEQWFRRAQRLAPNDPSVYHHYGTYFFIFSTIAEIAFTHFSIARNPQRKYIRRSALKFSEEHQVLRKIQKWKHADMAVSAFFPQISLAGWRAGSLTKTYLHEFVEIRAASWRLLQFLFEMFANRSGSVPVSAVFNRSRGTSPACTQQPNGDVKVCFVCEICHPESLTYTSYSHCDNLIQRSRKHLSTFFLNCLNMQKCNKNKLFLLRNSFASK